MYILPRSRAGWWALWLLLPVLFYPFYWSLFLLLPQGLRATGIVVAGLAALTVVSVLLAGLAILHGRERSALLIAATLGTVLLVVFFAVGEFVGH